MAPTDTPRRVFLETYGCQMNVADSELVRGVLARDGWLAVSDPAEADAILVNTCAIRDNAEERVLGRMSQLLQYKQARPEVQLGLLGCVATHQRERLLDRAPYLDVIVGPDGYRDLPSLLRGGADPRVEVRLDRDETYADLEPALAGNRIRILPIKELTKSDLTWLEVFYWQQVRPVLTPLALDPAHPFPQLLNKSLNLIVRLEMKKNGEQHKHMAVVQLPAILPRLVQLPRRDGRRDYVYLGQLIGHFLADIFPGTTILGWWPFRVTRNSELYIDEEEENNLLKAVEAELHNRRRGDAVRLEIDRQCPAKIYDPQDTAADCG